MKTIPIPDSELLLRIRPNLDEHIRLLLSSQDDRVPQGLASAMRHATLTGGKRLRGLLLVGIVDALGGDSDNALRAGSAVEMVHAASLALDDLPCMDDAEFRRGEIALHRKIGEDGAILSAIALISLAYEVLCGLRQVAADTIVRVQTELAVAVGRTGLVAGQWADLRGTPDGLTEIESINISKTGALFEFASRCGALISGASAADVETLGCFGRLFGLAYQMLDDDRDDVRRTDASSVVSDEISDHDIDDGRMLDRIRQVLSAADQSARGTAWCEVARAFVIPALAEVESLSTVAAAAAPASLKERRPPAVHC